MIRAAVSTPSSRVANSGAIRKNILILHIGIISAWAEACLCSFVEGQPHAQGHTQVLKGQRAPQHEDQRGLLHTQNKFPI